VAPGADGTLIELRGVTKHFHLGHQIVVALRGVDLDVAAGEFTVVMGPSGSGKSTLLNLIGGLDRPTSGSIVAAGETVSAMDEIALATFRRREVGFVFQAYNLIPTMTARQNVEFPMTFAGVPGPRRRERAATLLGELGLKERMGHRPVELSGGEQQRVAIARALANEPKVVLADEPTGNLDTKTGREVMDILAGLNTAGLTVVVVTHDPRVASYADRVVRMLDGRIVGHGPPSALQQANTWEAY